MVFFLRHQECLSALLDLSKWAWAMLKVAAEGSESKPTPEYQGDDDDDADADAKAAYCASEATVVPSARMEELSHMIFVCRVSMRLLRFYILELYPSKRIGLIYPNFSKLKEFN